MASGTRSDWKPRSIGEARSYLDQLRAGTRNPHANGHGSGQSLPRSTGVTAEPILPIDERIVLPAREVTSWDVPLQGTSPEPIKARPVPAPAPAPSPDLSNSPPAPAPSGAPPAASSPTSASVRGTPTADDLGRVPVTRLHYEPSEAELSEALRDIVHPRPKTMVAGAGRELSSDFVDYLHRQEDAARRRAAIAPAEPSLRPGQLQTTPRVSDFDVVEGVTDIVGTRPRPVKAPTLEPSRVPELSAPVLPATRICCLLAPSCNPLGASDSNLADPSMLGLHGTGGEVNGLIYTGKAGIVDLGHVRDVIDLTKYVYDQIVAANGSPAAVTTKHGAATFVATPTQPDWIKVARAIAYDDSFAYEIYTYGIHRPGGHNSSFSPEDLPSNYLGTIVAERAIAAGGPFNDAVTADINACLASLDAQTKGETTVAFNLINHRWVEYGGAFDCADDSYLRRRNFDRIPWKAGHRSDAPTPAWVTDGLAGAESVYTYTHTIGRTIPKSTFASEVAAIRADAMSPARYGPDYDKP